MILPFPSSRPESVNFKLLMNSASAEAKNAVKELFRTAKDCFPVPMSKSWGATNGGRAPQACLPLKVERVGSYDVSVAETVGDLPRFDPKVFQINPKALKLIQTRYPTGFGFLICQITESKPYHPFGYIHDTLSAGTAFVPTYHYHEHASPSSSSSSSSLPFTTPTSFWSASSYPTRRLTSEGKGETKSSGTGASFADDNSSGDWDHKIYLVSTAPTEATPMITFLDNGNNVVKLPVEFSSKSTRIPLPQAGKIIHFAATWANLTPRMCQHIVQITARGSGANGDILMEWPNVPTTPTPAFTPTPSHIPRVAGSQERSSSGSRAELRSTPLPRTTFHPVESGTYSGINCDGCGAKNMAGVVYHYTICKDVDFCRECVERLGRHSITLSGGHGADHTLVRFDGPLQRMRYRDAVVGGKITCPVLPPSWADIPDYLPK